MASEQKPDVDLDVPEVEYPSDAPPREITDEEEAAWAAPSNPTNTPLDPIGPAV